MKTFLLALSMAVAGASLTLAPSEADARRLGGGRPAGMQRQLPPKPAQPQSPQQAQPQQAAPQNAATPAAAAPAARRSWLGPVAGIAAGLGIAALLSHLGLGPAVAEFLTLALLMIVAVVVVRWLLRRFAPPSRARAAAGAGTLREMTPAQAAPLQPFAPAGSGASPASALPAGFDVQAFERIAKTLFIRLQAANDAGEVEDLRRFTTAELFASLRLDLQDRAGAPQRTDVVQLDAELVDTTQERDRCIASVRFKGLIREHPEAPAESFDELWHFVRPNDGQRDWAIAGITPAAVTPA